MRAVRLFGPELPTVRARVPVPRLRQGDALLRVRAAGVCHTDLQLLEGALDPGVWPLIPGHEIAGEVVSLHPSATPPGGVRVGSRVLVYYGAPCFDCEYCLAGQEQVCVNGGPQPGLSCDGGFAEFVRVPAANLVPLPPTLDFARAAPLGCAAVTALHAVEAVARVQAGDTVVVYGTGGVGLMLLQIARANGAEVIAVGRRREKLEAARKLGAEIVCATDEDPATAVRRKTAGAGVDFVFDLVGTPETSPSGLAMLRRRGSLVLVGYGSRPLSLRPLEIVQRELQILGSVGNTRAELEEVVRRAAAGELQVLPGEVFPLSQASDALAALRAGTITGRAVLAPDLDAAGVWADVEQPQTPLSRLPSVPSAAPDEIPLLQQPVQEARPPATDLELDWAREAHPLQERLLNLVGRGIDGPRVDAEFNEHALALFAYQFARNAPYRALCSRRGQTPDRLTHWRQIPPVPIAAFKETLLVCEPTEGGAEFNSSGTTSAEKKSRHFHPSLLLYDLNARLNFKAHVLPDRDTLKLLVLNPPREAAPHSSLAHWLQLMVESFGQQGSGWYVDPVEGLDAPRFERALREVEATGEPVGVLAASFALVHFLEYCLSAGVRFHLPTDSRVMDTGGYKGRSREYPREQLYSMITELLGVDSGHIVNMYGMTEHGTQFLDATLRDVSEGSPDRPRRKIVPPWARTVVVDPDTLRERPAGEPGLLLHVDLINRASVAAVLSEDVGYAVEDGFELIGRVQGSEARGCSIALDELLAATRG